MTIEQKSDLGKSVVKIRALKGLGRRRTEDKALRRIERGRESIKKTQESEMINPDFLKSWGVKNG